MSNHPSRNWRRRAESAADQVPQRDRASFLAGYEAGRLDGRRLALERRTEPYQCEVCGTRGIGLPGRLTCSDACRSRRQYRLSLGLPVGDAEQR